MLHMAAVATKERRQSQRPSVNKAQQTINCTHRLQAMVLFLSSTTTLSLLSFIRNLPVHPSDVESVKARDTVITLMVEERFGHTVEATIGEA